MAKFDSAYVHPYTRKVDLKSKSASTVSLKTKCQWKLLFELQFSESEGPIKKQPWLCYSRRWATPNSFYQIPPRWPVIANLDNT